MVGNNRMHIAVITAGATVLAMLATPRAIAATTVRYAAPNGSGTACTSTSPCSITQALSSPPPATKVVLGPGSYGSPAAPLSSGLVAGVGIVAVGGTVGAEPAVIYSSASPAFLAASGRLHDLTVVSSGGTAVGTTAPGTAVRVTAWSTATGGIGCEVESSLTDSVCLATGTNGIAVASRQVSGGDLTTAVRNVTAEATGAGGTGLLAASFSGGTASLTADVTNDILHGSAVDIEAVNGGLSSTALVFVRHSDFNPTRTIGGDAIDSDSTNISAPPVFVDASHGDLREQPSSPTVDAGASRPAGTLDRLGHPRAIGKAPDIGAYELLVRPTVTKLRVTRRTRHSIIGYVRGNGRGLPTHVTVVVRRHGHLIAALKAPQTPAHSFKAHFALHFLRRHTTYRLRAVVHSIGGTARSPVKRVSTRR
jgi:hypothetical protein